MRTYAWKHLVIGIRYAEDVSDSTRAKGLASQTMRRLYEAAMAYLPNAEPGEHSAIEAFLILECFDKSLIQEFGKDMGYDKAAPEVGYIPTLPYSIPMDELCLQSSSNSGTDA